MNFEEVYKEFLIYSKNRYKKQGFYNLSHDFNNKVLPYFRDRNIEDITKIDILNWQNKILEFNYRNSYNSRLYFCFNTFMQFCCDYHDLEHNYVKEVGCFRKKIEEKHFDFYNLREYRRFIRHLHSRIYKCYFEFLYFTGVRPSEAMALKLSDRKGFYIRINKNIQRKGNRELDTLKNSSSYRTIKIDLILRFHLWRLKRYYFKIYYDKNFDYFIFGGKRPLAPTTIDRYKFKACKEAHIRPITMHQFRHSHATLLLQRGIMINEVARRLGHSEVSTTLNIYAHTDLLQEKRVFNTLNSMRFNFFYNLSQDFKNFFSILKR